MKRVFFLLLLFIVQYTFSQNTFDYRSFTKKMCSPEFHGRGYVNNGDATAAKYIAEHMKSMGIESQPSGYFQPFNFNVNTFPDTCRIVINGKVLNPGKDYVAAPFSNGNCTMKPCKGSLKYRMIHVTGEEVLIAKKRILEECSINDILVVHNTFYSSDSSRRIQSTLSTLSEHIPIIELVNNKFTWSVSQEHTSQLYIQLQESRCTLNDSIIEIHLHNDLLANYETKNVIGKIPSKKKPKGTIMLTAHYDHLGRLGSDTYFPGGNDNASGVAMLLQLGAMIKEKPLKRYNTILVAFAGEEVGLLGSKYMSESTLIDVNDVRFLLNLDIMGSGEEGITAVNGRVFTKEFELLQKMNRRVKAVPVVKARGKAANSDHYFFTEKGVRSFFIYTMGENKNYHDVYDTYENLSFSSFDSLAKLFNRFLRRL